MKKVALLSFVLFVILSIFLSSCTIPQPNRPAQGTPTGTLEGETEPPTGDTAGGAGGPATSYPLPASPTPPPATATLIPDATEAGTPATPAPPAPTAGAEATAAPVATLEGTRIQFAAGATSTTIQGTLAGGSSAEYILQAGQGQQMRVDVSSPNNDVYLKLTGADGNKLLEFAENENEWSGTLPTTQDYSLRLQARGGQTAYSITVTITGTPPAAAVTPQPTANVVRIDPFTLYGQPYLRDPMDGSNRAAWADPINGTLPDTNLIEISIENRMTYVTGERVGWSTWWFSWPSLENFFLQLTSETQTCSGKDAYGLIIRGPQHGAGESYGYVFAFSCDGYYQVYRLDSADPFTTHTLVDWTRSEFINTGTGARNVMGIRAVGDELTLYANGYMLAELEDNTYITEGRYGLYVSPANTNDFTYRAVEMAYWRFR